MSPTARTMHAMHITALGVWLGALVMSAATAAVVFPTMRTLGPRLPDYAGYTGEHWSLAAGLVQAQVFVAADIVQLVCFGAALVTLVYAARREGTGGRAMRARIGALGLLLAVIGVQFFLLNPKMDTNLITYRDAARAGDNRLAAASRDEFRRYHLAATAVYAIDGAAVLAALAAGAWAGVGMRR